MKNSTLAIITLSVLIISMSIAFTLIIKELIDSKPSEVDAISNEPVKREARIEEPMEQAFPTINLGDGVSGKEFWDLYNYWNEKDGYGLPEVNIKNDTGLNSEYSKKIYMGNGVYLSYVTSLQYEGDPYAPVRITGEELEDYNPDVLAAVFDLTIKIVEGKDSSFYKYIHENSMDLIKGRNVEGDNYEWKSYITPYEVSFRGYPIKEETEQATYFNRTDEKAVDETEHNGYVDENQENTAYSMEENYLNESDEADVKSNSNEPAESEQPNQTSEKLYRIQAGVFSSEENALALENDIKNSGIETAVVEKEGLYVVYVGAFKIKENADKRLAELVSYGFEGYMKYE